VNTTDYEMGVIVVEHRERPTVEWSLWGRLDAGIAGQHPNVLARRLTLPDAEPAATWEAAAAAELTLGVARDGGLRVGAWGELRTSSARRGRRARDRGSPAASLVQPDR
jgi:hypothetical protein